MKHGIGILKFTNGDLY